MKSSLQKMAERPQTVVLPHVTSAPPLPASRRLESVFSLISDCAAAYPGHACRFAQVCILTRLTTATDSSLRRTQNKPVGTPLCAYAPLGGPLVITRPADKRVVLGFANRSVKGGVTGG